MPSNPTCHQVSRMFLLLVNESFGAASVLMCRQHALCVMQCGYVIRYVSTESFFITEYEYIGSLPQTLLHLMNAIFRVINCADIVWKHQSSV